MSPPPLSAPMKLHSFSSKMIIRRPLPPPKILWAKSSNEPSKVKVASENFEWPLDYASLLGFFLFVEDVQFGQLTCSTWDKVLDEMVFKFSLWLSVFSCSRKSALISCVETEQLCFVGLLFRCLHHCKPDISSQQEHICKITSKCFRFYIVLLHHPQNIVSLKSLTVKD